MNILQINSSARLEGSRSRKLADEIVARLQAANTSTELFVRDLTRQPHPALDEAGLQALFTPPEQRTPQQAARVALNDELIAEIQAADIVVLGVPMYNFGIPSALKSWIDAIARAGVTFRYTAQGPEGLLKNKQVYIALARGGVYAGTPADTQVPYLKAFLGFVGMTDVHFIYAEGLDLGGDAESKALSAARSQIEEAIPAQAIPA